MNDSRTTIIQNKSGWLDAEPSEDGIVLDIGNWRHNCSIELSPKDIGELTHKLAMILAAKKS